MEGCPVWWNVQYSGMSSMAGGPSKSGCLVSLNARYGWMPGILEISVNNDGMFCRLGA